MIQKKLYHFGIEWKFYFPRYYNEIEKQREENKRKETTSYI